MSVLLINSYFLVPLNKIFIFSQTRRIKFSLNQWCKTYNARWPFKIKQCTRSRWVKQLNWSSSSSKLIRFTIYCIILLILIIIILYTHVEKTCFFLFFIIQHFLSNLPLISFLVFLFFLIYLYQKFGFSFRLGELVAFAFSENTWSLWALLLNGFPPLKEFWIIFAFI